MHQKFSSFGVLLLIALLAHQSQSPFFTNAAAVEVVRSVNSNQSCSKKATLLLNSVCANRHAHNAFRLRAECFAADGQWKKAIMDLTAAGTKQQSITLLRRGEAEIRLGDRASAIRDWHRIGASSLLSWRGEQKARMADPNGALEWLTIAADVSPENANPHWWMGQVYQSIGRIGEAEAAYREAAKLAPDDIRIQLSLVNFLSGARNDGVTALHTLLPIWRRWPDRVEPLITAGQIESRLGHYDAAASIYNRAELLDPSSAEISEYRGLDFLAQGRIQEAIKWLQRAVVLSRGTNGFAHYNLGFAYSQAGQIETAKNSFENAINAMPRYVPFRLGAGRAYEAMGHPCEAYRHYRVALNLDPTNAQAKQGIEKLSSALNCR